MIAIPLDQSYSFKIFICFLAHILNLIIYNKYITIDKVSHSILYIRDKINNFNPDESVWIRKILKNLLLQSFNFYAEKWVLLCIALSLNISILQLKLKKRFGETKIKKIWDGNKIEKKGDLKSIVSPISKSSFFGKGLKNDFTTDREIENVFDKFRYLQETWVILANS